MSAAPYTITPARYAKGKMIVRPNDGRDGLKGRSSYLAEALGGRWVDRSKGYTMSPGAAGKFETLYAAGFTGCSFPSKQEAVTRKVGARMSVMAAMAIAKAEAAAN